MYSKKTIHRVFVLMITLDFLFVPVSSSLAQTDGIPLQKDLFLEYPITTTDDLPDQLTFNLYDPQSATMPITNAFTKGHD